MHLEHRITSTSPELCWALGQGNPAPNTNPPALFPLHINLLPLWLLKRGEQSPPRRGHGTAEQEGETMVMAWRSTVLRHVGPAHQLAPT